MMVNNADVHKRLHGMVDQLERGPALRDDLMQEALIHLWQMEEGHPGQCERWYLQGCLYHLRNWLRQGRSVDSLKHFRAQVLDREQTVDELNLFELAEPNGSLWDEVSVNDFMAELSRWLTSQAKDTLLCLMDGLSARETAKRLNVSHTVVNRHRSQIANLALKLGIAPSRNRPEPGPK